MNKLLIILALWMYGQVVYGQSVSQRTIYRSGKYYYYTAYAKDSLAGKEKALQGLHKVVGEALMQKQLPNQNVKVLMKNVKYFFLPLIEEIKTIAYIDKTDLEMKKTLSSIQVVEKKTDSIPKSPRISIKNTENTVKNTNDKIKKVARKEPVKQVIKSDVRFENLNPVLKDLLSSNDKQDLFNKIKKFQNQGKIQVVTHVKSYKKKFSGDNFYKILFDKETKEWLGIVDKANRKNLKTGKQITSDTLKNNIQLWLRIL